MMRTSLPDMGGWYLKQKAKSYKGKASGLHTGTLIFGGNYDKMKGSLFHTYALLS